MQKKGIVLLLVTVFTATTAYAQEGVRASHPTKVASASKAEPKCKSVCPKTGRCLVW
jgi:hypothetical protein